MSSIHINKVKQGLSKVKNLGHTKETFDIFGHEITVRTITPSEREKAQEKCEHLLEEAKERDDIQALQKWMSKLKIEVLAYSIIQVGDLDLEGVKYIETDEVDPDTNKTVKKQKHIYMREFLEDWNREIINISFKKFREITEEMDERLNDEVEFEDEDLDARIEKKKQELEELKEEKLKQKEDEKDDDRFLREEVAGESISEEDIKEDFYSPDKVKDLDDVELGDVTEEPSPEEVPEEMKQEGRKEQVRAQHQGESIETSAGSQVPRAQKQEQAPSSPVQQGTSQGEVEYVDEDGEPLTGAELEQVKRMEQLQRQKQSQPQERDDQKTGRQGREPLNQTGAKVKEGTLPDNQGQSKPKRNAQKAQNPPVSEEDIPIAEGFDTEPEKLGGDPAERDLEDVEDEE